MSVERVDAPGIAPIRAGLGALLVDSVHAGASVGFLAPLSAADADAYWRRVEAAVAAGTRALLVATDDGGGLAGTVQLDMDTLPNGTHRATVGKLLVHTSARRRGLGAALMAALEDVARGNGRWLLWLDTATGEARRLYERTGWTLAGVIPRYARFPDGELCDTYLYWKDLRESPPAAS